VAKEAQMTFRVEPALRTAFAEAALQEDRPAAQILREFMRAYVSQVRERSDRFSSDLVSPAEGRRRADALNFARASIGLEGFKPHTDDEALAHQYVAGEITIADAIHAIHAIHASVHER